MESNFNQRLLKLIGERCQKSQAAHFYQIKLVSQQEEELFISQWLAPLANTLFFQKPSNTLSRVMNHSDFYLLGRRQEENQIVQTKHTDYNLDDISEFTKFANTPPWQGNIRLSVVFDTHKLNALVSNKLLKTLEEPAQGNIIFFINTKNQGVLQTIESRSVNIRLSSFIKLADKTPLTQELKGKSLTELISLDKTGDTYLRYIQERHAQSPSYVSCQKLLQLAQWAKLSKEYNNPYQERLSRLYLFDKSF